MRKNNLITLTSRFAVHETIERLASIVTSKGLMIFARIDHGANAAKIGMELRPTELLIFGNPKGGTPLMQDKQTSGLDLPVRVLGWEDADGHAWLSYDDPAWVAERHGLGAQSAASVTAIEDGLTAVCNAATNP